MQEEARRDCKSISSARCEARSRGGKAGAANGAQGNREQRHKVAANRA